MITVEVYAKDYLDENEYELTDTLFRKFNLLNETYWTTAEIVGIAYQDPNIVGVIIGYENTCTVVQVAWDNQRKGIGSKLVKETGLFYPQQNGAPEFWEYIDKLD